MIEVTVTTPVIEPDRRYRNLVVLQRSDRPRYYTFHCPYCTMPLCEIANADVFAITDLISYDNLNNVMTGIRCSGRTGNGRCNVWFYWTLNPA